MPFVRMPSSLSSPTRTRRLSSVPLDSPVRHEHARSPAAAPQESIYSVAFGWPIEQSVIQTTRRASSMQYQTVRRW